MQLYSLSLQGKWDEMREVIPEDVLRGFAQTSTYDNLPDFFREHREYATHLSVGMPTSTPEQVERFQHVLGEVRKVETSGVRRDGLTLPRALRVSRPQRPAAPRVFSPKELVP